MSTVIETDFDGHVIPDDLQDFQWDIPEEQVAQEALREWGRKKPRCACCWIGHQQAEFERWPGIQVHHIIKRSRHRCDEPFNLLRLCERCHRLAEGERVRQDSGELFPILTLGLTMWLKLTEDQAEWNPERLGQIYHRALPGLLPVPRVFWIERHKHVPVTDWRDL